MEKVMAITPDDIRKINLLIGEIDPRITKVLNQFADGDADRLEMFKLRASLLLEYNTPFWANTKDSFKPGDILIKKMCGRDEEYWIFDLAEQDKEKDGIRFYNLAKYMPHTKNGACVKDLETSDISQVGIGCWTDDFIRKAPEEAIMLFKAALNSRPKKKTVLPEPSDINIPTEEETRSIAKAYSQKPTVEYKYPDGTVLAKAAGAQHDIFLFRYRGSKVRENGWNPILYDHLVTITPDENGKMVVAQSAGYPKPTVGIGYDNDTDIRVPTEEELALFNKTIKKDKK